MTGRAVHVEVALLAEGVDRNHLPGKRMPRPGVALLAEGVDRNKDRRKFRLLVRVALLAEGVDRNIDVNVWRVDVDLSPSSRRAWIEITRV